MQQDPRAKATHGIYFNLWCRARHDDNSLHAQFFRRHGNPLCMVSCRSGDDSTAALLWG